MFTLCSLLLDWYLGSQKLREILMLLCCIIPSSSGKSNASSRSSTWHQAKFHYFHACFGFIGIKKTKFVNVSNPATMPRILNFIPISCMEPRNLPEDEHVIFQPTLVHWNMCLYFKFELCTQRWHVPSQNHEPSWEKLRFARRLYQNLFLFGQFFTTAWYYHDMTPCQVSWF